MTILLKLGLALFLTVVVSSEDEILGGTERVFAFIVFRHGDRTPENKTLFSHYGDEHRIRTLVKHWGYGQLTNAGIKTSHKTGEFIRRRYSDLIRPRYDSSEIYIRSTDLTRTKMSVLSALAAIYPPTKDRWSTDTNWVPVPYTTVPAKYDFILSYPSCPSWVKTTRLLVDSHTKLKGHQDLIRKVASIVNNDDIRVQQLKIFYVHDVYRSLINLGYDIGEEGKALMPNISAAAGAAWDYILNNDSLLQLHAGVLLNEFFKHANKVIDGRHTERVRLYSVHDTNVYSLEAATKVKPQGIPNYGSLYSLELRRVVDTGKYVVLPVYLSDPHKGVEKYLEVQGCGGFLCDYDTFYKLTSKYRLLEESWAAKCGLSKYRF